MPPLLAQRRKTDEPFVARVFKKPVIATMATDIPGAPVSGTSTCVTWARCGRNVLARHRPTAAADVDVGVASPYWIPDGASKAGEN